MKYTIVVLCLLFSFTVEAAPPSEATQEFMDYYRIKLNYESWPKDTTPLIPTVDLFKEMIPSIQSVTENITKKNQHSIQEVFTNIIDHEYCTRHIFNWNMDSDNDVGLTLYINNSRQHAYENLLYIAAGYQISPLSLDSEPVAGDLSFNKGRFFIRNNVVVGVACLGVFAKNAVEIAQEVDAILMQQKTFESSALVCPVITDISFIKHGTNMAVITPKFNDPQGTSAEWKYRNYTYSGNDISKAGDDSILFKATANGEYELAIIANNEAGFTAAKTLWITVTENDIFK